MPSSRNWVDDTVDGASVNRQTAFWVLGKAMTSRMDLAPDRIMAAADVSCLAVVTGRRVVGFVTERELCRRLDVDVEAATPVGEILTRAMGYVPSFEALAIIPVAFLGGLAFGALGMAITSVTSSIDMFNLPLFLFITPMGQGLDRRSARLIARAVAVPVVAVIIFIDVTS